MLDFYRRVGRALHAVRALLLVGVVAGVGLFVNAVFNPGPGGTETPTLVAVLVCVWSLGLLLVAYGFSGEMPVVDPRAGLWRRTVTRVKRLLWHGVALAVTGLGVTTIVLTLRALAVVSGEHGG